MQKLIPHKNLLRCLCVSLLLPAVLYGGAGKVNDSLPLSTPAQAIAWLDQLPTPDSSHYWVNVSPALFIRNLRDFATAPLQFYEGRSTNFCAYSAITFIPLEQDPLGFCQFMTTLYKEGKARFNNINFNPGKAIHYEAGILKYKGALDINPAAQMWFLCLADRFKGYLNFMNRNFDKGDENTLWAATNYAKFNRMLRKLSNMKVNARGSDLIRPGIRNEYAYIREKLDGGIVFLYLNNRLLYRKKHWDSRFSIPTHFALLLDIEKVDDDKINIIYWDYGAKTLQQVSPKLLKKIIFGITDCREKQNE